MTSVNSKTDSVAISSAAMVRTYPKLLTASVVVAIILLAINMRAPIIGFGTVAHLIQADLGLGTQMIGLIGTIPMIAFAMSSFLAAKTAERVGLENTLTLSAGLLALGIFIRVWQADLTWLLIGSVLLSVAIAFANVLVSAAIKKYTPDRIGIVMGAYSMTLSVFAGVASIVVINMARAYDWQWALGSWGWISVMASTVWLWILYQRRRINPAISTLPSSTANAGAVKQPLTSVTRSVWRMPMAWFISIFMGLQSLLYYTLASFLPTLLIDKGLSQSQAGTVGMVFQLIAFPAILLLSKWVSAGWNLRVLAMLGAFSNVLGIIGFGFLPLPGWVWMWAVISGFGCGVIFTLCMMMFTIKARDTQQTADLSGMAQTVGYSIAIFGPLMTGWLRQITHGWTVPILVLVALMLFKCGMGWLATQDRAIE